MGQARDLVNSWHQLKHLQSAKPINHKHFIFKPRQFLIFDKNLKFNSTKFCQIFLKLWIQISQNLSGNVSLTFTTDPQEHEIYSLDVENPANSHNYMVQNIHTLS